jgi:uncharacterized protein YecT (DUF1311 family)
MRYDIFISYRRDDRVEAELIYEGLKQYGYNIFFDNDPSNGIPSGENYKTVIDSALSKSKTLLVILSQNACLHFKNRAKQDTDWVVHEIEYAHTLKKKILPVVVNNATMPTDCLPEEIKSFFHTLQAYSMRTTDIAMRKRDIKGLAEIVGTPNRRYILKYIMLMALVLAVLGWVFWLRSDGKSPNTLIESNKTMVTPLYASNAKVSNKEKPSAAKKISPAFDCRYAKSYVEHRICTNEKLEKMDIELNRLFWNVKQKLNTTQSKELDVNEDRWVSKRDAECLGKSTQCIEKAYASRMNFLREYVPPSVQKTNSYVARISTEDHFTSKGKRLKEAKYILIQDRANYHKKHADPEDENDKFFSTVQKRQKMYRMEIVASNIRQKALEELIVHSTPLLKVTVVDKTLIVELLEREAKKK